jgi:hypothetical protein
MWGLGGLSFAVPWALAAAVVLPALWWLLRVIPPAPRRLTFPAIRLLMGLEAAQRTAARTPWWLVMMRLVLATLVILAVAHPLLHAVPVEGKGPLLAVIDDGWAAAKLWPARRAMLDNLIAQAQRAGQPAVLLPTAPPADGAAVAATKLLPAGEAKAVAQALQPHPWPTDRAAAAKALDAVPASPAMRVVWLADGVDGPAAAALADRLQHFGPVSLIRPPALGVAKLLMPPRPDAADLATKVRRAGAGGEETVTVRAADAAGRTLARQAVVIPADRAESELRLPMPSELRNRVARLEVVDEGTAGAVVLLDDRWKRRPVGLVDDMGGSGASPLLDDLYYAERALAPAAEIRRGPAAELLKRELSVVVLPDSGGLPDQERQRLKEWIEKGGLLVRLAGPKLARNPDDLLPVRLRGGGRVLGGAMSWTKPMALAPMPDNGPFAGLAVPPDLRVKAQVLAEPTIDLNERSWARLEDGTPLVTAAHMGKGWLVLIHTTVWPAWSNLGLSGLFPEMMHRLLDLSLGVPGGTSDRPLPPADLLDGFGRLVPPAGAVEAVPAGAAALDPGPRHPPGYYGDDGGRKAFNLAPAITSLGLLPSFPGVSQREFGGEPAERDLQPPLLLAALALLLCDMAMVLVLRGVSGRGVSGRGASGRGAAAAALLLGLVGALAPATGRADDATEVKAALQTRLAYVVTGDSRVDDISRAGLTGLSQVLEHRTTAVLGEPMGVDIEHDSLMVFPLLYWPVTGAQGALDPAARDKVNDFMRHGGMILFDTQDRGEGGPDKLRTLAEGLDIPPLAAVTQDHVLTRAFYLLPDLPGRYDGAPVYVQDGGDPANDNVSPVVIGSNDWAAAWAIDRRGSPMFAVVPGGEQQREMAYRFGVNLVMYALTGSYKADQVHLPAILERLRR